MQCLGSAGGWRHLLRSCAYLPCAQLGRTRENLWIRLDCNDGQIFVVMWWSSLKAMQYQCFLDACDHRYWTDYLDLAITDNVFRYNCFFFRMCGQFLLFSRVQFSTKMIKGQQVNQRLYQMKAFIEQQSQSLKSFLVLWPWKLFRFGLLRPFFKPPALSSSQNVFGHPTMVALVFDFKDWDSGSSWLLGLF